MSRPAPWLQMVRASKQEALLAVKLYNDPHMERSLEGFGVHMHLAWLYLLQAEFLKLGKEIRYPHPSIRGRFELVDGEHRTWELGRCVEERWSHSNDPVRANLEFFIKFRNKTEHRYKGKDAALLVAISDKSQALLLNYEAELTSHFGAEHTLAHELRFPVFIGTFTEPAEQAMRRLRKDLPSNLKTFLADYEDGLDDSVIQDSRFAMRLQVKLEPAQRGEVDVALRFVRDDELTPDERSRLADVGKTGAIIVKERSIPVANADLFKYTTVVQKVAAAIPFPFNREHLKRAIQNENIKPPSNDPHPERTRSEFCQYDALNKNYGYKQAYVDHLIRILQTSEGFIELTGLTPTQTILLDSIESTAEVSTPAVRNSDLSASS